MAKVLASTIHGIVVPDASLAVGSSTMALYCKTFQLSPERDTVKVFITGTDKVMQSVKAKMPGVLGKIFADKEVGEDRTASHKDRAEYVIKNITLTEVAAALKDASLLKEGVFGRIVQAAKCVEQHRANKSTPTPFTEFLTESSWEKSVESLIAGFKQVESLEQNR